ncbi:phosphotransferase [Streptomyces sp. SPB074]|uniref:phosphotransferase n=1 Tax=Streptomyces sp. (strain SPB074) TaxID=465543 RepID=UPI0001D1DFCE|nr:phosphotransferase [Streptomyces sp. SPB074]EFG65052.1 GNAT family acetyltransferase [Streptomyces sp. SPB074]
MPALHADEIPTTPALVRELLAAQMPEWAGLPLRYAGAGTDNTMYRLGEEYVVRLPRTPAGTLERELTWAPRLAPHVGALLPEPVRRGAPSARFPAPWCVLRWLDGAEPGPGTVRDWATFGTDLATFVRELRGAPLMGARRADGLSWYRGGQLHGITAEAEAALDGCAALGDVLALDLAALREVWEAALALPDAASPEGWLHGDLRPANLLVQDGALHAVLDFGTLSLGLPDAEHAPVFDLPPRARTAYREALALDDTTWARALAVAAMAVPYYWSTLPDFAAESLTRLRNVLADAAGTGTG